MSRFIIVNVAYCEAQCWTDDEGIARDVANSEDYIVIDTKDCTSIIDGVTKEIPEYDPDPTRE